MIDGQFVPAPSAGFLLTPTPPVIDMTKHDPDPWAAADRRRSLAPVLSTEDYRPLSAMVQVEFGSHSQAGVGRQNNEDHFLILNFSRSQVVVASTLSSDDLPPRFEEHGYAMVVGDGAGKQGSGAVASRIAVSTLAHLMIHHGAWNLRIDAATAESVVRRAEWFYQRAAQEVDRYARADSVLGGMRTTLTAAFSAGNDLFYSHVGHSRAYLFRDGELTQMTRDHTVQQRLARVPGPVALPQGAHDLGQILTDAIGAGAGPPAVDVERIALCDRDVILICTDGLTNVVDDHDIADVLTHPRSLNEHCRALAELAVAHGSHDDITAVLAKYRIPGQ
jgi:protein phosphatase